MNYDKSNEVEYGNKEYKDKLFTASCAALNGILANSHSDSHSDEPCDAAIEIAKNLLKKLGYGYNKNS